MQKMNRDGRAGRDGEQTGIAAPPAEYSEGTGRRSSEEALESTETGTGEAFPESSARRPGGAAHNGFTARRMVFDAMLIALFVVLSFLNVRIGNVFKIGFSSFATIVAAILLGPADGFLVGFAGEFLEQILTYGLTPTTILYMAGPGARGLVLGLVLLLFSHGAVPYAAATDRRRPHILVTALLLSSFAQTMLNTLANYVDSKLYGWYSPEIVFGSMAARTVVGFAQTFVFAGLAITVLHALRNSHFIPYPANAGKTAV